MARDRILNARSDDLARVREHVARYPEIRPLSVPFEHLPLVIDTNRALQDVAWIAKRQKRDARTSLQELCASGFVTLYAPEQLVDEVERHLGVIAENVRVPRERVEDAWASYVGLIHVIATEHLELVAADSSTRDPTDLPFLAAQQAVGAHGILSKDKDLAAMGALIVKHEALRFAIEFARSRSIVVEGTVLGTSAIVAGGALVYGAFKGALAMVRGYRRLPGWLQALLPATVLAATALVVFHAPTRARVRGLLVRLGERAMPSLSDLRKGGGDLLDQYVGEMQEADGKARAALALLREQVPVPSRKPTLRQLAYRACLEAEVPLTPSEIENRARLQGYESRAKDLERYVRSVLHKDRRLVQTETGWTLTRRAVVRGPTVEARRLNG